MGHIVNSSCIIPVRFKH